MRLLQHEPSASVAGGVVRLLQHERHPDGPSTVDFCWSVAGGVVRLLQHERHPDGPPTTSTRRHSQFHDHSDAVVSYQVQNLADDYLFNLGYCYSCFYLLRT